VEAEPFATVSTICALLAIAAAILALRNLRTRIAATERRGRTLEARIGALEREQPADEDVPRNGRGRGQHDPDVTFTAIALLWSELKAQRGPDALAPPVSPGGDCPPLLPERDILRVVENMISEGDVLEADRVVRAFEITQKLPLRAARRLARGLRDRGYLERAQDYFAAAAALGEERDRANLALRQSEVAVMRGEFAPAAMARTAVTPVPGRVLHVVGRAVPTTQSGYTLRTHSTARAQRAYGLDPHVFVQLGITDPEATAPDQIDGVTYHRPAGETIFQTGHAAWLQANTDALLEIVEHVRPAVLHAHSDFFNALIARAVGTATGVPVIYEARGFWEESWLSRTADKYDWEINSVFQRYGVPDTYSWRRAREAEARAAADHVVTLARVMSRRIVDSGLPAERLTIVPNAVDGERFTVDQRDDELVRQLGIPDDVVIVGCITSVVEYEGIDVLIDACSQLLREGERVWLLVVGDGPVLPALKEHAARAGLAAATFTGRVRHEVVLNYYSVLDIVVVPRRPVDVCHLVTPLKPFEAFAAERTVLMSDVEALREIAEDSGAAELFRAGQSKSLAATLRTLIQNPTRRALLARAGAEWVRRERSWDGNARIYAETYGRMAGRPTGSSQPHSITRDDA